MLRFGLESNISRTARTEPRIRIPSHSSRVSHGLVALCALLVGVPVSGQTASELAIEPTRALQIPPTGRNLSGQVDTTQRTSQGQDTSDSVNSINSTVIVSGPYAGSVPAGSASQQSLLLTLGQALTMGLQNNLGVVDQSASEQQARGQQTIARSALLPHLYTVVSDAFEKENFRTLGISSPMIPTAAKYNYYDARAARLTQTVLDFVKVRNLQGSEQAVRAEVKAARNTRDLVVLAVAGSYLQLTATKARVESARAQVKEFRTIYQRAADRQGAGLATRVDATRADVQLQTQQQRLRSLEADLATQKLKLARLIGLPLGQSYDAAERYHFNRQTGITEAEALEQALQDRTDLQAASAAVRAAELVVKAAQAQRLPSLEINADFGAAGETPTNHSTGVYMVAGTLTIPLYQGGRVHGDEQVALAALSQRRAEEADVRGQIDEDVRQAFINLSAAADQVDVAESNRKLAHESLDQSTDRFFAGIADTVEVVQAEQAVVQAEDDLILAEYEHNLGKVSLTRAIGNAEQTLPQWLRK